MKTVNILGQEYKITDQSEDENEKLKNASGIFEGYSKEIIICSSLKSPTPDHVERLDLYRKKVIRHEIIHGFFHEAGLANYCEDETLVNWLALQLPKIVIEMNKLELFDKEAL